MVSLQIQSLFLAALGIFLAIYPPFLKDCWRSLLGLPIAARVGLGLFGSLAAVSTTFSEQLPLLDGLFGTYPGYFGLLQWLACFVLALWLRPDLTKIAKSPTVAICLALVMCISIIGDHTTLNGGFRLSGLLLQATSMGLYACLGFAVALIGLDTTNGRVRVGYMALTGLAMTAVILTQSRAALFALALIGALSLVRNYSLHKTVLLGALTVLVILGSFFTPSVMNRYHQERVAAGAAYRHEIYKVGLKEIAQKHLLIGNGADSYPSYLNDGKRVPEDIAQDLQVGYRFSSAHDIFIDIGNMFGALPMLLALLAAAWTVIAFALRYIHKTPDHWSLTIFTPLLVNALINVPLASMTCLGIVFMVAGLGSKHAERR